MGAMRVQAAKQGSISPPKSGELKSYKKAINRSERRKAKINPECVATYRLYTGYRT